MSEHSADEPGRPEAAPGEAAPGADPGPLHTGAEPPRQADADQAPAGPDAVDEQARAAHDAAGDQSPAGHDEAGSEQDELAVARRRLAEVADLPVEEHAAVYEDVHRSLQEALAEAGREREPDDGGGAGSGADPRAQDDGARDR